MADFLYVCDGTKPSCGKTFCRWTGAGECSHTTDVAYARYPEPRVFADVNGDGSLFVEKVRKGEADER